MKRLELIGKRFGRLIVISGPTIKNETTNWDCLCDCGNRAFVKGTYLVHGITRSCGCYQRQRTHEASFKGGRKPRNLTREYICWKSIKSRCYNPKNIGFKIYGGRGIKVCDRWKNSFENFFADMGEKPPGYSIERINNDGNYEPGNCRWATFKEQCNNRRTNHFISYNGQTKTIAQWSERIGLSASAIHNRIAYHHWDIKSALTLPKMAGKPLRFRTN